MEFVDESIELSDWPMRPVGCAGVTLTWDFHFGAFNQQKCSLKEWLCELVTPADTITLTHW